jgi:hypothetical protein
MAVPRRPSCRRRRRIRIAESSNNPASGPGYLQRNGVPYSENAVVTEFFNRTRETNGDQWLVVTTTVEDPQYLAARWTRSSHFKKLPDGAAYNPPKLRRIVVGAIRLSRLSVRPSSRVSVRSSLRLSVRYFRDRSFCTRFRRRSVTLLAYRVWRCADPPRVYDGEVHAVANVMARATHTDLVVWQLADALRVEALPADPACSVQPGFQASRTDGRLDRFSVP